MNFLNFRSEFSPEFSSELPPNFRELFVLCFPGNGGHKIHQKSLPFFNAKSPGTCKKNIHNIFLAGRQIKLLSKLPFSNLPFSFSLKRDSPGMAMPIPTRIIRDSLFTSESFRNPCPYPLTQNYYLRNNSL